MAIAFNEMLEALEHNHAALQRFLATPRTSSGLPCLRSARTMDLGKRPDLPADERVAILVDARDESERVGRLIGDLMSLVVMKIQSASDTATVSAADQGRGLTDEQRDLVFERFYRRTRRAPGRSVAQTLALRSRRPSSRSWAD